MKDLNQFEKFNVEELNLDEMTSINGGEASPATKAVFEFCGFVASKVDSFISFSASLASTSFNLLAATATM
jgi:hypothetical protein